jgi:hypothetical protein
MAKKSKKISVKIIPNAGEIIQYGNKFRNIKTMKFASKRDFAKSNYKMILDNPAAFKKVIKSAKGFDSYYNSFRYNGKQLKRPIRDFLLENLSQSDKKQIKEAKKKKGLVPDLNMIVNEASMNTLFNAFNFTFNRKTSYELETGFLTKEDNMYNIIKELAYYREKGYKINIIDLDGNTGSDITVVKNFEREKLAEAQEEMEQLHTTSNKAMYLFNIQHELTVNDQNKTVTLDLRNAKGEIRDSKEAQIFKENKRKK